MGRLEIDSLVATMTRVGDLQTGPMDFAKNASRSDFGSAARSNHCREVQMNAAFIQHVEAELAGLRASGFFKPSG